MMIMKINYRATLKQLAIIMLVIVIGTFFDFFAHNASPRFSVPGEYFINKIIYGSLFGLIIFKILRNYLKVTSPGRLALWMSLGVAVILQTKYFLQGYDLFFVGLFMILHFFIFLAPAYLLFVKNRSMLME